MHYIIFFILMHMKLHTQNFVSKFFKNLKFFFIIAENGILISDKKKESPKNDSTLLLVTI